MRTVLLLVLVVSAGPARADVPPYRPHSGDAQAVGKQLIAAMGGDSGWQRARYFRFDAIFQRPDMAPFVRSHYWDRKTGRYRLEGTGEDGAYRVYMNVNTRKGDVWVGGKKLTGAAKIKKRLDDAYEAYAKDTMSLLAPFRIFDTDTVSLWYEDLGRALGGPCDILGFNIRGIVADGESERHSMCVDQKSHLVALWDVATGWGGERDSGWSWSDWQQHGPLLLATLRTLRKEAGRTVRFDKITVSETPDDAALTPPQ